MKRLPLTGRARLLGDDINTDYIISSTRKKESIDPKVLRRFLLEGVDKRFAASVMPGDILVAGNNFGCGSAMEVAVTVLLEAGIAAVVAKGFARTYLRNAMNNGLLAITTDTGPIAEGDTLTLRLQGEEFLLDIGTPNQGEGIASGVRTLRCEPIPPFMRRLLDAGGLIPYLRIHGRFV